MPLPDGDATWPPKDTEEPRQLMDVWGAWYGGRPEELARVYGGTQTNAPYGQPPRPRPSTYRGGLVGTVARMFWGSPPNPKQYPARLHVPIAGDIASVNADLLFGEAPAISTEEKGTDRPVQQRLDFLMTEGGLHSALLEGAEVCSGYGGVYLRASWDREVADHPLADAIIPDTAAPEWRHGRLVAVTFWRVVSDGDDQRVVRHLERHEPGRVYHGLYEGTRDSLGRKKPLAESPATEPFASAVDAQGGLDTGAPGRLAVEYVPNMRPHRLIRGSPLGRSDYAGVEQLMDALDEAWSSLMREVRLAKARLMIGDSMLATDGRGTPGRFDVEQEIYDPVRGLQKGGEGFADMMELIQPNIRVQEHSQTCQELTEQIVRGAGFSAQTFGESGDLAVTATEVQHRERRTYSTRARKIGYWQPALGRLLETMLMMDATTFGTKGVTPMRPTLGWTDGVQDSPEQIGRTVQLLEQARAASTQTKVQIVHQDWDEQQVAEEVERIEQADQEALSRASSALVNGQSNGAPEPNSEAPNREDDDGATSNSSGRSPSSRDRQRSRR